MNAETITKMLEELRTQTRSDADVEAACKLVAEHDIYRAFVLHNLVKMISVGFGATEQDVIYTLRERLKEGGQFEKLMFSPYLATVAIGFKLGKESK